MAGSKGSSSGNRWVGAVLAVAVLVAALVLLQGYRTVGEVLGLGRVEPRGQLAAVQVQTTPAPTSRPAVATPKATPMPAAVQGVTQEEAEAAVRAWFEALRNQDYGAAERLTAGSAAAATRELATAIRAETQDRGVQIALQVRRLDLTPMAQAPGAWAVRGGFQIQVDAVLGPASVPVQQIQGGATFVVERLQGQVKIADILDATGLPSQ